jgi:hypothetical protein
LDGHVFGPHGGRKAAEMIARGRVKIFGTGDADIDGGVRRSTGDGLG